MYRCPPPLAKWPRRLPRREFIPNCSQQLNTSNNETHTRSDVRVAVGGNTLGLGRSGTSGGADSATRSARRTGSKAEFSALAPMPLLGVAPPRCSPRTPRQADAHPSQSRPVTAPQTTRGRDKSRLEAHNTSIVLPGERDAAGAPAAWCLRSVCTLRLCFLRRACLFCKPATRQRSSATGGGIANCQRSHMAQLAAICAGNC